jgi:hypothetical protein
MLLLEQAALPVLQELLAYPVRPVRLEQADLPVHQDLPVLLDSQALPEHLENQVLAVLAVLLGQAVLLEHLEQVELLVHPVQVEVLPVLLVRPDHQVLQEQADPQDRTVLQAPMELVDNPQLQELQDHLDQLVHQD